MKVIQDLNIIVPHTNLHFCIGKLFQSCPSLNPRAKGDEVLDKERVKSLWKPPFKKKQDFMKNFHKMVTPPPVLYL